MQANDTKWSKSEKKVAQAAFKQAYDREIAALIQDVRERAGAIAEPEDVWRLHEFLSAKQREIDDKYDYRYSVLIVVFARLIREGWLHLDELEGLDPNKLARVTALMSLWEDYRKSE